MFRFTNLSSSRLILSNARNHFRPYSSLTDSASILKSLNLTGKLSAVYDGKWHTGTGPKIVSTNPGTGETLAEINSASREQVLAAIQESKNVARCWRETPAPIRGDVVRKIADALRRNRESLGALISLEVGKIRSEGIGEVQEYIDVCDYASGISRALHGRVIPSERASHLLLEQFHPVGLVGVISAFNFPVAVYGWNQSLACVTGNTTIWKPAPSTPLSSIAVTKIVSEVFEESGLPGGLASMVLGGTEAGETLATNCNVDLVSFTGSTHIGRKVGVTVQERFGKSLLELGGNNAIIVCPDADLDLALSTIPFAAVGTAGQRCTTTRRLLLHSSIYDSLLPRVLDSYSSLMSRIGDPLDSRTLIGPLHSKVGVEAFERAVEDVKKQGGQIVFGGKKVDRPGFFVQPTVTVGLKGSEEVVRKEVFAPILHVLKFDTFEEAVEINNAVGQGLSSSLFTRDPAKYFKWISASGSDCGIVNVNVSTSGAEIGGAFGGEKETGGGRESGTDCWKNYTRRMTSTICYGNEVALAQGVQFT
ncbi:alpha-aminoadipic semialdehyde dehydrogenase [Cladochytrium replicatum]|nr:alpha-aminoadipic semialdehyde dehydrogenase [Cladochytrium replicatum]